MKKYNLLKKAKKNYEFILSVILLVLILIISFKPTKYVTASFIGIKIWATIVLPSLFVFFFLTKLLTQFNNGNKGLFNVINKPFNKIYKTKSNSGYIFFMSIVSGYPIGAKIIEEFYNQNLMSLDDAKKTISFCSTSGPMFILGSVATQMFGDYKLGLVVLLSHTISALINGLLYRNIGTKNISNSSKKAVCLDNDNNETKKTINDIMYDSILSILIVGGYITLCFTLLEFVTSSCIYNALSNLSNKMFGSNILEPIIKGFVELTSGCVSLSQVNCSIRILCIILTGLISFGGLSIHLQSQIFFKKIGISYKYFFKTKITQTIISIIVSAIFSMILL